MLVYLRNQIWHLTSCPLPYSFYGFWVGGQCFPPNRLTFTAVVSFDLCTQLTCWVLLELGLKDRCSELIGFASLVPSQRGELSV